LIQDHQIVGKFNFIEFSPSSQPAIEKTGNLILNGSSPFFDNVGNPHTTGNIINQGQFPEQFLNLVATFYDNSSLGIVGTQSFGLNVANLSQNQMAPFDITITDNKTKSQAAFYSLNLDSTQNSMSPPFNPKFTFDNGATTTEQFITGGLFVTPSRLPWVNNNQGSSDNDNYKDENSDSSGSNGRGHSNGNDLNCEDIDDRNFPVGDNDPNNLDADGDGIGCETNEGNDDQTNNDDEQQPEQTTDPRNDPKYDSINWQVDDPDKKLIIEVMDEILGEQQSEEQENSGNHLQQEQDKSNNGSDDGGESTDETANEENDDESDSNDEEEENN
jgi:hypothetical protein